MGWSDIDKAGQKTEEVKQKEEQAKAAQLSLAKQYARLFQTDDGQKVFQDLFNKFIMTNHTDLNSKNINYEAAYHNGESGVIHYIQHQITKAQSQ